MEEAARSNSVRLLITGNAADRIRERALDSSRAVISASTRVRRSSSGFHRCVLAVTSSSGARRRIPAIFSRFSPAVRSAARVGGAVLMVAHRRAGRPPTIGSAPTAGGESGLVPAGGGGGGGGGRGG